MRCPPAPAIVIGLLLLPAIAAAQGPDVLGVYFDPDGTEDRHQTTAAYEAVPLYVVLHAPSEPSGVSGWEARIEPAGPAALPPVAWTYASSGINLMTPPYFQVGLGLPLPWAETLVLATGTLLVPDPADEVEIRVGPLADPSLLVEGYPVQAPAYAAGDDPNRLVPLTPTSGCETTPVAVVNDDGAAASAGFSVLPATVDFGSFEAGTGPIESFTVTCDGELPGSFEAVVDTSAFALRVLSGPWSRRASASVRVGQVVTVSVLALADERGALQGTVELRRCGGTFATVSLVGTVAGPPGCELLPDTVSFGDVLAGTLVHRSLEVRNPGALPLLIDPVVLCGDLQVSPDGPTYVMPGTSAYLLISWRPLVPGPPGCEIGLGSSWCRPVVCTGTALAWDAGCEIQPAAVDFGEVDLASAAALARITVTNTGGQPLSGAIPESCSVFAVDPGAGDFTLLPSQSHQFTVRFDPTVEGAWSCDLDLGDGACASLPLAGAGVDLDPVCLVSPLPLDFGTVEVGDSVSRTASIHNTGGGVLTGTVPESCGPFQVTIGAGDFALHASGSYFFRVRFAPTEVGTFSCSMPLSGICAHLRCVAVAVEPTTPPDCVVEPTSLDFGEVGLGRTSWLTFTVSNNGGSPLSGDLRELCRQFELIDPGPFELAAGTSRQVWVGFTPDAVGQVACEVGLGSGICANVSCTGVGGYSGPGGGEYDDMIGLYFDGEATQDCAPVSAQELRTAYLCLSNPTGDGIAGWECRVTWEGGVDVYGWQVEGTGPLNVFTPPEFQVGLGVPHPGAPVTVLASALVMPTSTEDVWFFVKPLFQPSIPGVACYADGADPDVLIPLVPSSGSPDLPVAGIGATCSVVPAIGGVPEARLVAGGDGGDGTDGVGVQLFWRYDPAVGDGCHLYRRRAGEPERRLTDLPLSAPDGRVEHVDPADGLAAGTELTYRFGLLRDGVEVARSAEVSLRFQPPTPSRLVLRPPRPNPFNPSARLSFELPRPGRVRLSIHDLAGRLVAVLADEDLAAGTHERTWDGRDDAGRRVPSGVYYCRLATDRETLLVKATLLK